MDREAVQARPIDRCRKEGCRRMSNDPVETFKLEASDLLEQLEQGLMDLEQDPQNPE